MKNIFTGLNNLTPLSVDDADSLYALRSNEEVNKYLDRDAVTSSEQVLEFIEKIRVIVEEGKGYYWVIRNEHNELIGTICLYNFSADRTEAEVGYELLPSYQKKGIMQAALRTVIDLAYNNGYRKLLAYTHRDNPSSASLLLRNGFRREEAMKDPFNEVQIIFILEAP